MEQHAVFFSNAAYFLYRLYCAHLVVGVHHADEDGGGRDSFLDVHRVNHSFSIYRHNCNLKTFSLKVAANLAHGGMLDGCSDDMVAFVAVLIRCTFYSPVVGLGATAGKNHFRSVAVEQCCHLAARLFDGFARVHTVAVRARRVAKILFQIRTHGGSHLPVDGRSSVVIEINGVIHRMNLFCSDITYCVWINNPALQGGVRWPGQKPAGFSPQYFYINIFP